ncbi:MAG: hypothetical protein CMO20_03075 [Thermoplasmata archaeon]|nr:hypothetical protein [Thermoplasmata archaeon]
MDWKRVGINPITAGIIGFLYGASSIWWALLTGTSLYSALFAFAYASIEFAFKSRELVGWIAFFSIIFVGITGWTGYRLKEREEVVWFTWFTAFVIGWTLARTVIFVLLDIWFFLGAIVTMPFVLGTFMLAATFGHITSHKKISQGVEGMREAPFSALSLSSVLVVALLLTLPNLTAMAGILPSPPERPETGYGSTNMPYQVNEYIYQTDYPEDITKWWNNFSQEYEWNVHVFVPVGIQGESIGVAIMLHGHEGEAMEFYRDTMESLAGQGVVAIFPQYVSDVDLSSVPDDFELTYLLGGSDHPQHEPRFNMAMRGVDAALDFIANDSTLQGDIGGATIDTNHLWIGGHSMGVGSLFYVLDVGLQRGWGSESLVINLEAPWVHAIQPDLDGNMSLLPDHALIHVVEYEGEIVVDKCIGRWQHARLHARDGSNSLPSEQVLFLQVPSDYRGFPRLIASHYLPAAVVRESLSDQSYYPRIEAQADFIASSAIGDNASATSAKMWFMEPGEMTDLGKWSNGEEVNPIKIVESPLELPQENNNSCPIA